jgi:hypothetical protein
MLQCFRSLLCPDLLLALGRWSDLPKCPLICFAYPIRRPEYSLFLLQLYRLLEVPSGCPPHPQTQSLLQITAQSTDFTFRVVPLTLIEHLSPKCSSSDVVFAWTFTHLPLRTAGTARRMTRFRAAESFCRDTTLSWIRFLAPWRRRTTRRRYPYRSSDGAILSKFICSLKGSCRSTAASVSSGFASNVVASISSEHDVVSVWQVVDHFCEMSIRQDAPRISHDMPLPGLPFRLGRPSFLPGRPSFLQIASQTDAPSSL